MGYYSNSKVAKLLSGILFAGIATTWAVGKVKDEYDVARRDESKIAHLTQKTKTICFGRMLIDMPEDAQVQVRGARIDGFDIASFEESSGEFQERLADREAEIKAKPDRLGGDKNLELVKEVQTDAGIVGKIFVHSRTVTEGTAASGLELKRYRYEGVAVEALVHAAGISIDLATDFHGPDGLRSLTKLVHQLVANFENKPPAGPGFCIDRAYFRDPLTADQGEQITMFAGLPTHPDIDFMFILAAGLKPDAQGLLERSRAGGHGRDIELKTGVSNLRAEPRKIAGLDGEELARSILEQDDVRVHSFQWEVSGTQDNVYVPYFVFRMNTGQGNHQPVQSSLSEDAALMLWDTILSSIRVRPVSQDKGNSVLPAPLPLAERAAAK